MNRQEYLHKILSERIVLLDGAMGTMIQAEGLDDDDFILDDRCVSGCNEVLNLTRGDVIFGIHTAYLEAGADIIETNTFCANAFNLEEYGLTGDVLAINQAACEIAREAAADFESSHDGYAFVAGVIGPTNRSLSFSSNVDDPAYRESDFASFKAMYTQQAEALLDGSVDLLLIETAFDTLVAKSAIMACLDAMQTKERKVPLMVSATFSDQSGRTLSGQTLEAFVISLSPFPLFSLGLNCSTGPAEMLPLIKKLSESAPFYISAHPNAGFPDKEGMYTLSPSQMAKELEPLFAQGCLNIVGGCCGTTPSHIRALAGAVQDKPVHTRQERSPRLVLAGLEACHIPEDRLLIIGERTNVAGSRKFARLIKEGRWEEALTVARTQIEEGASVIDLCMDASMLDAQQSMVTFLRHMGSDPSVSRVPPMVDSSDWSVIARSLEEIQGRGIINSISLKEGEELFIQRAKLIASYGCAMVVMLFDEEGQADSYEQKIAIAKRSYNLLLLAGIRAEDIIFDANVLTIATGLDEHDHYGRDFLQAVSWIKKNLPHCSTIGGVSNLSFAFRGNNVLRDNMHAIFLDLSELDMGIVNPAVSRDVQSIGPRTKDIITRALLAQGDDLPSVRRELIDLALETEAEEPSGKAGQAEQEKKPQHNTSDEWKTFPPRRRLAQAVIKGENSFLEEDLALLSEENPLALVEGPLMDGMKEVGDLFGKGRLFLPQVVRSARTMKMAVDILQPRITAFIASSNAVVGGHKKKVAVIATVKGDVHDIGKNIVSLILTCNNFEVIDLGVMVPKEKILASAVENHADLVGLSGLITPSLREMASVITLFEEKGCTIPIFVGGATTSELHTAVKLSPLYGGAVIQTRDASAMALTAQLALGDDRQGFFIGHAQETLRLICTEQEKKEQGKKLTEESFSLPSILAKQEQKSTGTKAKEYGVFVLEDFSLPSLAEKINWKMYCASWKVPFASEEGGRLVDEAQALLKNEEIQELFSSGCKVVCGLFPAHSDRLEVKVGPSSFYFLRNEESGFSLADAIAKDDTVGLLVATSALKLGEHMKQADRAFNHLALQMLADRLAEVLADEAEAFLRQKWGCSCPSFIRPAPGYSSWSDHSEKRTLFDLLGAEERIAVRLTESYAMDPASTVCSMLIGGEDLRYFAIGKVSPEQLSLYAQKKGMEESELVTLLSGMEY
ncbi:MAG TPA: methionine synthase [Sphaerochaeta sp.]|nr:methionine synthase [Sphaerochaeta sp.]